MHRPVWRLRRRAALVAGLALAAAAVTAPAHAAPSVARIDLDAPASVEVGVPFTVTVVATGAVDLYAYDLSLAYDPDLVAFVDDSAVTPDGGFADTSDDGVGTVSVTHTRLGTSPGLEGDVTLATVTFTGVAAGDADLAVPAAVLVGTDSEQVALTDAASVTTTIAPAPTPTDPPTDVPTGGGTTPTDGSTTAAGDDGASDPSSSPSGSTSAGSLARTGASIAWIAGAALLAVAAGVVVLLARRRAVTSR